MTTFHSARESDARARAAQRLLRQRGVLRPLGLVFLAAVAIGAINSHPAPAAHGRGLGVVGALIVFVAALLFELPDSFLRRRLVVQALVIAAMGAAGVALVSLQPHGAPELAASAAVWMAVTRLPLALGTGLAAAMTVGVVVAEAFAGASVGAILAVALLCALLALVAYFLKQSRESQDTTELLLAQLEDAREQQLEAAAIAERGRIAGELHDVLAHSLSGAAIQLEAARKLAEREGTSEQARAAIGRAGELVRDGLVSARQAVGALRGDDLPTVARLESLVASFRSDTQSDVTLAIEGSERPLPADASLALYRGAQEALTNVARHASGADTTVVLRYGAARTTLTVEDRRAGAKLHGAALDGVGGGNGLAGMRERLERLGGTMSAGPTEDGWRVELDVPA